MRVLAFLGDGLLGVLGGGEGAWAERLVEGLDLGFWFGEVLGGSAGAFLGGEFMSGGRSWSGLEGSSGLDFGGDCLSSDSFRWSLFRPPGDGSWC